MCASLVGMSAPIKVDVAVIGAGTAGASAAYHCARRGLSVACLDGRPLEQAGARWVNGVPAWAFDEAGLARPEAPERLGGDHPFHILAGWGPRRVTVTGSGVLEVDMRLLVGRLQRLASEAGARLLGEVRVSGRQGRRLETTGPAVEAEVIVDASGLGGAGLVDTAPVPPWDICTAAQEVRDVVDRDAALAWVRSHEAEPDETLCFTGVAGGYSIVNVRTDGEGVSILTGSIPAMGFPSGRALLDRFVEEHPWVGDRRFGGARPIPLRRPEDRPDRPLDGEATLVLLGDAGCQLFTAHGSGIAAGLLAASDLAEALAAAPDGRAGARRYAVQWMRRRAPTLAAYDVFRRYSASLAAEDIEGLMDAGLITESMSRPTLAQRDPPITVGFLVRQGVTALRSPGVVAPMVPILVRMERLRRHYRRYPEDPSAIAPWARRATRIAGDG